MGLVCSRVDLLPQPDGTMDARCHTGYVNDAGVIHSYGSSYFMVKDVQSLADLGARAGIQLRILNTAEKKGR